MLNAIGPAAQISSILGKYNQQLVLMNILQRNFRVGSTNIVRIELYCVSECWNKYIAECLSAVIS